MRKTTEIMLTTKTCKEEDSTTFMTQEKSYINIGEGYKRR